MAAALAVLAYSTALNEVLPRNVHLPANLVAAGAALLVTRAGGSSWEDLGLGRAHAAAGVRTGLAVAAPLLAVTGVAAVAPRTRHHFANERVLRAEHPIFESVVRIPIGTALCEELIFRGALLARFRRRGSFARANALTAATFGAWHVLPTWAAVRDEADPPPGAEAATEVLRAVALTAVAGLVLGWLRRRSGSVWAPVIAHTAMNASAFVAAHVLERRGTWTTLSTVEAEE